jgi:flagellar assembly protein FliH
MVSPSSARAYSRFIPKEEIEADSVTQWSFAAVDGSAAPLPPVEPEPVPEEPLPPGVPLEPVVPMVAEDEHLALLLQAREQAHAQGLAEGRAQGTAEATQQWQQRLDDYVAGPGRETAERLDALVRTLDASLGALQQRMAKELLQLACDIARQVVRRELASNPQALLPVVREALDMLVNEGRPATVRLNPADWAALEQPLHAEFAQGKVQWQPDPSVAPGDCQVESAGTVIDGSMEKRWRRAVAALGLVGNWQETQE